MTTTITQIYVGLETSEQKIEIKPQKVIDRISRHVEAGTFHETKGLWQGELEDSIMFESVELEENLKQELETVEELKSKLETVFNQESVMVKQYKAEVRF